MQFQWHELLAWSFAAKLIVAIALSAIFGWSSLKSGKPDEGVTLVFVLVLLIVPLMAQQVLAITPSQTIVICGMDFAVYVISSLYMAFRMPRKRRSA